MSSAKSSSFAPRWLKCTACAVAIIQLPGVLAIVAVNPQSAPLLYALPVCGYVFMAGLGSLMSGQPPRALFMLTADLLRGRLQSVHDQRDNL